MKKRFRLTVNSRSSELLWLFLYSFLLRDNTKLNRPTNWNLSHYPIPIFYNHICVLFKIRSSIQFNFYT